MTSLAALALTVLAIAYATLAPFEFNPPNGAEWTVGAPGLRFARAGIAYTPGPHSWSSGRREYSIDLWLEPGPARRDRLARLLAVQDEAEVPVLSIDQWIDALIVRDRFRNPKGRLAYREYALAHVLEPGRVLHVTLVSDENGMRTYLDGQPTSLASGAPGLAEGEDLSGRLLLGNAARGSQQWTGTLHGLAFTAAALGPEAVAQRSRTSAHGGPAALAWEPDLVALYPFDEGAGAEAHDLAARAPTLRVPAQFQPLRRTVLRWPDTSDRSRSWFLRDLATNVAGFLPAGFFAALAMRRRRALGSAALVAGATLFAAALSLAIELTQVWLPSRVSSLSDVAGNATGGALGSALAWLVVRRRAPRADGAA